MLLRVRMKRRAPLPIEFARLSPFSNVENHCSDCRPFCTPSSISVCRPRFENHRRECPADLVTRVSVSLSLSIFRSIHSPRGKVGKYRSSIDRSIDPYNRTRSLSFFLFLFFVNVNRKLTAQVKFQRNCNETIVRGSVSNHSIIRDGTARSLP